ncbi:MAG: PorT family protein [Bacteroidetes bacterium]|nr:PorT family protein [Bacteroidota bacterium]
MKYSFFFILLFLFFSSFVTAQKLQYGGELGINMSGAIVKDPGGDPKGTPLPGFQLGAFGEYMLPSSHLAVGARLLYSYEGYKPDVFDTKATVRVSFIKIPLNLIYKGSDKNAKWSFGFGPYFAFGIGGHYQMEGDDKVKINFGSNPDKDDLKRVDIGADLMAGYKVNDQIMIRAAFDFGLINYLTPGSSNDASARALSFGITGCYSLGK